MKTITINNSAVSGNKRRAKGTEALLLSLLAEGVDTLFGYPGGTIMPLYDELYNYRDKLNHILVRHEQGAVHAAQGYARSTGKPGVCVATAGPGATNFVTGIADAMMDSTPIICITAQVSTDKLGSRFFQEADMIGITLPITKWSYQITEAKEIPETVSKAFRIALSGRPGPVVISLTRNAQVETAEIELKSHKSPESHPQNNSGNAPASRIEAAAELINSASKPLIIAGQGVTLSGSEKLLKELAEKGNIPVATTLLGISSIPTSHPLYFGNVGMHGHIAPNVMTQQADVIIAAGMRFSDRVTGETKGYAPRARIVHIEIDKAEINKNVKADIALNADAARVLKELNKRIKYSARREWLAFGEKAKRHEYDTIISKELGNRGNEILMGQVAECVSRQGGYDSIIVTDVGQNQMFSARYAVFARKRSWITSGGLGTMGFGLPAAIGAKTGNPDKNVVAVLGDGGFQMNIQELGTIMQSGINVKIVLLNNSFLGMVRQWQELFFDKRYSFTPMANPDFIRLAESYGIKGERIDKPAQLEAAIKRMYEWDGAYLLEAVVKSEENVFPMVPAGATLDEIILKKRG